VVWMFLILLLHILGILSAFKAVMETRTSQGAIAWVIFLVTFPYVSLPVYWILGRNKFRGYMRAKHIKDEKIEKELESFLNGLNRHRVDGTQMHEAAAAAEKLAVLPVLHHNDVTLLVDGERTFESMLQGISEAKYYILFQFYIVNNDEIGKQFKDALIRKAKEGISVYFLYDEIGSYSLSSSYIGDLKEAGVRIYPFHTQKGFFNRFQLNFRNHRKVLVVDGTYGWVGGHNIGDEYMSKVPKFGHWRDTHIKLYGPAVLAMQLSFVEDWFWATDEMLKHLHWEPTLSSEKDMRVLIVPSGPADELETAALMFHHAINSAQKRIWIATPYFVPDDATLSALQLAGLRGVDVRILIPEKPDHLLVYFAASSYFEDVMQTGVRFFRYEEGFLHEKVMLIDDDTATVGTANFDNRSFRLNFEITAVVKDREFSSKVEAMFADDFTHSNEMKEEEVKECSTWFVFLSRLARLTSPIQ